MKIDIPNKIIIVVTVDDVVKMAAVDPNRAEEYADNMRTYYPNAEVTTWPVELETQVF